MLLRDPWPALTTLLRPHACGLAPPAAYLECNYAQQAALGLASIEAYYEFTFLDTSEEGLHYSVDCGKVGPAPGTDRASPCLPGVGVGVRAWLGVRMRTSTRTHAHTRTLPPKPLSRPLLRPAGRVHRGHPELGQDSHDASGGAGPAGPAVPRRRQVGTPSCCLHCSPCLRMVPCIRRAASSRLSGVWRALLRATLALQCVPPCSGLGQCTPRWSCPYGLTHRSGCPPPCRLAVRIAIRVLPPATAGILQDIEAAVLGAAVPAPQPAGQLVPLPAALFNQAQ